MRPGTKVGILGGGQLARMLTLQGHKWGLEMHVLSEHESDPAALVTRFWHKGKTDDLKDILSFTKKVDVITFESEFIPAKILKELEKESAASVYPPPGLLRQLQDRLPQKELLHDNGLPTSPFMALHDSGDLTDAAKLFGGKCVVKKRLGGYDGKGTFILKTPESIAGFPKEQNLTNHEFIVEEFIPFRREVALQVARNPQGQILFLPLVEIHQSENRLDWLIGPTQHRKLSDLQKRITKFLKKIDYVGVIAFELFDTGTELIVNEIAPRVHNSGHYTMEALSIDQFTLHLLAVTNQKLPAVRAYSKHFAMTNLLGQDSKEVDLPTVITGHLHWYGKTKNSKGRKIGHATYLGTQAETLKKTALNERKRMKL